MTPAEALESAIIPALALLPKRLDSQEARVLLVAIALQESELQYRRQMGNGPARGFWQFEKGTRESRGGVTGVYLHSATNELLRLLCRDRDCNFDPYAIWAQLEHDDVLAAGVARLMLLTNPKPLPDIGDEQGGWAYYESTWRPGKPHPDKWPSNYAQALQAINNG